ncbi:hypothetical protein C8Q76DRAFT_68211 [Earliella scabrosa]|nr:hypothetical protein C8Q76DRAFT_68211 [Earliella scabrosa]
MRLQVCDTHCVSRQRKCYTLVDGREMAAAYRAVVSYIRRALIARHEESHRRVGSVPLHMSNVDVRAVRMLRTLRTLPHGSRSLQLHLYSQTTSTGSLRYARGVCEPVSTGEEATALSEASRLQPAIVLSLNKESQSVCRHVLLLLRRVWSIDVRRSTRRCHASSRRPHRFICDFYVGLCLVSGGRRGLFHLFPSEYLLGLGRVVVGTRGAQYGVGGEAAQLLRGASSIGRHDAEDAMMHCATAHNAHVVHRYRAVPYLLTS